MKTIVIAIIHIQMTVNQFKCLQKAIKIKCLEQKFTKMTVLLRNCHEYMQTFLVHD